IYSSLSLIWRYSYCPVFQEATSVKLLALLAMIIDHTNTVFLSPAWPMMYALGRMAFRGRFRLRAK
ncbi:TraX family protein, partial [Enterobacter sp. SECR19-1250]